MFVSERSQDYRYIIVYETYYKEYKWFWIG